jgi:hypothetical protein
MRPGGADKEAIEAWKERIAADNQEMLMRLVRG